MVSAPARRRQVAFAVNRGVSARRACALVETARSGLEYESKRAVADAPVQEKMRELAAKYPRYGYRRVRVFLARAGLRMSAARAHRLWRRAGLQVPRRRPRRRVAQSRPRPQTPTRANQVWAIDFVHDACADGRTLKCLTVVDEWTRECLAIDVARSIRSGRVIDVLSRLVSERGVPTHLRSDNGPEFVSKAILAWALDEGFDSALIDPGKPWQNGTNESFNGSFRDECLSLHWFRNRVEAATLIEEWRRHYNDVRPHSSLGYKTPSEFTREERKKKSGSAAATSKLPVVQ